MENPGCSAKLSSRHTAARIRSIRNWISLSLRLGWRTTTYFGEMVNHLIANVMKADGDDETLEHRQIGK